MLRIEILSTGDFVDGCISCNSDSITRLSNEAMWMSGSVNQ